MSITSGGGPELHERRNAARDHQLRRAHARRDDHARRDQPPPGDQDFSGLASGLSSAQLAPFIPSMHTALWMPAITSLIGAGVSLLRPRHEPVREPGVDTGLELLRHRRSEIEKLTRELEARRRRVRDRLRSVKHRRVSRAG